jgi:hypothetical protein
MLPPLLFTAARAVVCTGAAVPALLVEAVRHSPAAKAGAGVLAHLQLAYLSCMVRFLHHVTTTALVLVLHVTSRAQLMCEACCAVVQSLWLPVACFPFGVDAELRLGTARAVSVYCSSSSSSSSSCCCWPPCFHMRVCGRAA